MNEMPRKIHEKFTQFVFAACDWVWPVHMPLRFDCGILALGSPTVGQLYFAFI
jgi:hypothetical protein